MLVIWTGQIIKEDRYKIHVAENSNNNETKAMLLIKP